MYACIMFVFLKLAHIGLSSDVRHFFAKALGNNLQSFHAVIGCLFAKVIGCICVYKLNLCNLAIFPQILNCQKAISKLSEEF